MRLRTLEEQLTINTEEEISDYCVSCGKCCFFGPAACSKLNISGEDGSSVDSPHKKRVVFNIIDRLKGAGRSNNES